MSYTSSNTPRKWNSFTKLVKEFDPENHSFERICNEIENFWNFEIDVDLLSQKEHICGSQLFEKIVMYTPIVEDRELYSGFLDEKEIKSAIQEFLICIK